MHRIFADFEPLSLGEVLRIDGEEAAHALKVKRLRGGERVEVLNLRGGVARGIVDLPSAGASRRHPELGVRIESVETHAALEPRLEVRTATPKGGRVDDMIDQLTQVGAASWGDLACERSVVEPREHKLSRLERIAAEACKQSGRTWALEVNASKTVDGVVRGGESAPTIVIADAGGEAWECSTLKPGQTIVLLIGPEGGFTSGELHLARDAGARITRFGAHTMRIETAAVVAAGVILHQSPPIR